MSAVFFDLQRETYLRNEITVHDAMLLHIEHKTKYSCRARIQLTGEKVDIKVFDVWIVTIVHHLDKMDIVSK